MAFKIAANHGLATLRVGVRLERDGLYALAELVSYAGGSLAVVDGWKLDSHDLGMPARLTPDWQPSRQLPSPMVGALAQAIDRIELARGLPLWLHLVKPYGFLGAVDWEAALVPSLDRPLLRLPDFLERPRENRAVLDVALVCSEPVSEPRLNPAAVVDTIARAALAGSQRPHTTVHVFCDEKHVDAIRARCAGEPRIAVHDPEGARVHGVQKRGGVGGSELLELRSPWLLWMRDSMKGRALDAVHFVGHGFIADQKPAIALAESPLSNHDRRDARYVGVGELAAFLMQTGAWSAVFSSPEHNYSEAGLRLLADTLAQTRPGPVLYQRLHPDSGQDLEELYRFLYAPGASPVPRQREWFAYCQPAIVMGQETKPADTPWLEGSAVDLNAALFSYSPAPALTAAAFTPLRRRTRRAGAAQPSDPAAAAPSPPPELPSWVSAAQRYVEQATQQLQRDVRRSDERAATVGGLAEPSPAAEEIERTLRKLQSIVASAATTAATRDAKGTP